MRRPNRGCIVSLLAAVLGVTAGTARADDPPAAAAAPALAATEPPAAPMAPAERRFTGDKQAYFISGGVADSPFFTIGTTLPTGVTFSVGLSVDYDGNGLPIPGTTMRASDKLSMTGLIYGAYYLYNKFPVGIAAEAALVAPLAPNAFDPFFIVQPGVAILYAPFPAPIVLGTALDLAITKPKNGSVSVSTVTPGLRIVYVF